MLPFELNDDVLWVVALHGNAAGFRFIFRLRFSIVWCLLLLWASTQHIDFIVNNDSVWTKVMEKHRWSSHLWTLVWLSCPPHRGNLEGGTTSSLSLHWSIAPTKQPNGRDHKLFFPFVLHLWVHSCIIPIDRFVSQGHPECHNVRIYHRLSVLKRNLTTVIFKFLLGPPWAKALSLVLVLFSFRSPRFVKCAPRFKNHTYTCMAETYHQQTGTQICRTFREHSHMHMHVRLDSPVLFHHPHCTYMHVCVNVRTEMLFSSDCCQHEMCLTSG